MDSNSLIKKVQDIEQEILDDVVSVCKELDIPYFLDGGTLLGAKRHKGFIPWDDDIDIGIAKENWVAFESGIVNKLSDKYIIQSERGSVKIDSLRPPLKINYRGTYALDKDTDTYKNFPEQDQHIFIDVFRFSNVPESSLIRNNIWMLLRLIAMFQESRPVKLKLLLSEQLKLSKIMILIFNIFYPILKLVFWFLGLFESTLINYYNKKAKDSNYVSFDVSHWRNMKPVKIPKELIFPIQENAVEFNGKRYSGPAQVENYLEMRYGDWKKLPPVEKRSFQHFLYIDFGDNDRIK